MNFPGSLSCGEWRFLSIGITKNGEVKVNIRGTVKEHTKLEVISYFSKCIQFEKVFSCVREHKL